MIGLWAKGVTTMKGDNDVRGPNMTGGYKPFHALDDSFRAGTVVESESKCDVDVTCTPLQLVSPVWVKVGGEEEEKEAEGEGKEGDVMATGAVEVVDLAALRRQAGGVHV